MITNKRNIWIFGGTGFIGSILVKHLAANPRNLLHLLVHQNIPFRFLEKNNIFTGSLENFDVKWMERYPPEIIFHLARIGGSYNVTRYLASITGRKANRRLVSLLTALNISPVVVYVSGSLLYGNQPGEKEADENAKLLPVSYARYYMESEKPWLEAQEKKLLDVRFARPGWIVGPGSWFKIFFWNYYLLTGKVPLYGDGGQVMSLVHVDDCAAQLLNLAENGKKGQNLNIFSATPTSMQNFSITLANLLNTEVNKVSLKELRSRYGKTVAEAFGSSIPLTTCYPELAGLYRNLYPDSGSMLTATMTLLKHEQGVFAKTPQKSLVEKQVSLPK